jgi:hypothetical protein
VAAEAPSPKRTPAESIAEHQAALDAALPPEGWTLPQAERWLIQHIGIRDFSPEWRYHLLMGWPPVGGRILPKNIRGGGGMTRPRSGNRKGRPRLSPEARDERLYARAILEAVIRKHVPEIRVAVWQALADRKQVLHGLDLYGRLNGELNVPAALILERERQQQLPTEVTIVLANVPETRAAFTPDPNVIEGSGGVQIRLRDSIAMRPEDDDARPPAPPPTRRFVSDV